jgi:hypothetical protein
MKQEHCYSAAIFGEKCCNPRIALVYNFDEEAAPWWSDGQATAG